MPRSWRHQDTWQQRPGHPPPPPRLYSRGETRSCEAGCSPLSSVTAILCSDMRTAAGGQTRRASGARSPGCAVRGVQQEEELLVRAARGENCVVVRAQGPWWPGGWNAQQPSVILPPVSQPAPAPARISAANWLIGEAVQSRRRPPLGPSSG